MTVAYLFLVGTLFCWGSAFPAIKIAMSAYAPGQLACLRLLFAAATLIVIRGRRRRVLPFLRDVPAVVACAVTGMSVYHLALNYGETQMSAGGAGFIIAASPVFAIVGARFINHERAGSMTWLGVGVSVVGVALIGGSESGGITLSRGGWLVLLASASGGVYNCIQKRLLQRYRPLDLTTWSMLVGGLICVPWAGGAGRALWNAPLNATLVLLYLAVFPAALSYLAWAVVLRRFSVGRCVSCLYAVPVISLGMSWLFLRERPSWLGLFGGALALLGVALVQLRPRGRLSA